MKNSIIRKKAEERLVEQPLKSDLKQPDDILKLYHELEVFKIELEMQLEELFTSHINEEHWRNELIDSKNEILIQKELNEKNALELIKSTNDYSRLTNFYENRESKIMDLRNEIDELLIETGRKKKYWL
jgi:uncharacterized protein (DUF3084 family)